MSDLNESKGSCLCGAIHISAKTMSSHVVACHCSMCRKWAGGPLLAVDCGSDVSFKGKENISTFDSSEWAERGFCNKCGSHLFYRLKEQNQYIVPVGLFENSETVVFDHQIFIEEKPSFYSFANETKNMTGAEVFAQFSATSK
ncbi:MAG: GFA family protein [Sulfuricaulis sp.]|nr:GFA family protein [Sulfuricaulis sp.]